MQTFLLKQALIGGGKSISDKSLDVSDGRIDLVESVCSEIKTESAEWQLLLRAGCYSVADRVGFVPASVGVSSDQNDNLSTATNNVTKNIVEQELNETRPEISRQLTDCLIQFMQQFTKTPQITIHLLKRIDAARFRLRVET
ncbi:MAG: hypothetical protein LBH59_08090, partial [Planctomycetaceae bacterium]|nr:hypothetical protein [Planctomycetaceae bacterium]